MVFGSLRLVGIEVQKVGISMRSEYKTNQTQLHMLSRTSHAKPLRREERQLHVLAASREY
jgi:hypothetical protein